MKNVNVFNIIRQAQGTSASTLGLLFLMRTVVMMLLPFFPLIYQDNLFLANSSISSFILGDIIGGLIISVLADHFKPCRLLNRLLWLSLLALLTISSLSMHHAWALILLIFVLGACTSGIIIILSGNLITTVTKERKKEIIERRYWAMNLSALTGFVLSGMILNCFPNKNAVFLVCFGLLLFTLFVFFQMKNDSFAREVNDVRQEKLNINNRSLNKVLFIVLLANFMVSVAHQQITTSYPMYLEQQFTNGSSIYVAFLLLNLVLLIACQKKFLALIKSVATMETPSLMMLLIGYLFLHTSSVLVMLLAITLYSFGEMYLFPRLTYVAEKSTAAESNSRLFGLLNCTKIGFSISPLLSHPLILTYGRQITHIFFVLILTIGLILYQYSAQSSEIYERN